MNWDNPSLVLLWQSWYYHMQSVIYLMETEKHGHTLGIHSHYQRSHQLNENTASFNYAYIRTLAPTLPALILEEQYQLQQFHAGLELSFGCHLPSIGGGGCNIEIHHNVGLSSKNQQ